MSISLYVYSPAPVLEQSALAAACRDPGLPEELHWELAFLREGGGLAVDDPGPLRPQQILGWRPGSADAEQVRAAIQAGDAAALDRLLQREAVGSVYVAVAEPGDELFEEMVGGESLEVAPARYRDRIAGAASWYGIDTSAGRNRTSSELQVELWAMLGVLTGAVLEDPQEGVFTSADDEEGDGDAEMGDRPAGGTPGSGRGLLAGQRALTVPMVLLVLALALIALTALSRGSEINALAIAVGLAILVWSWNGARHGDRFDYWLLVTAAVASAAVILLYAPRRLVGPPPDPVLATQFALLAAAGALLLRPAARRYVDEVGARLRPYPERERPGGGGER